MMHVGAAPRRGLTLIELAIALAIVAVLGAMGMPDMVRTLRTAQLKNAAFGLQADVARGKLEALRRGMDLHVQFHPGPHWCYALSLGAPADCRSPVDAHRALKIVRGQDHPQVRLVAASAMALDGREGRPAAADAFGAMGGMGGQARWVASDGQVLDVQLGPSGRATVCSPGATVGRVGACQLPDTLPALRSGLDDVRG